MNEEKGGWSNSKEEKPKSEHRFSRKQYDLLKSSVQDGNITKWNQWRENNPSVPIELDGQDFRGWNLAGAYLYCSKTYNPFEGPKLDGEVYLRGTQFDMANLDRARFDYAHLEGSSFYLANLKGADFGHAWLQGASFALAIVDNSTIFWGPPSKREIKPGHVIETMNRYTNFIGVPLENVRIDPTTKQLLEYNIRQMNWKEWYKEHPKLKWPIKFFWWMSDYGLSTGRIIFTFFGLAIIFANIYYHWGRIFPPGIIGNLFIDRSGIVIPWQLVPLRTLYFSIVTMTTLGFGDMYAYPTSWTGHILLMVQVILGYVLLGALVTRFSVLFTAGGPAGKFQKKSKKKAKK